MPDKLEWQVSGHMLAHMVYLLLGGQSRAGGGRSTGKKCMRQAEDKRKEVCS